jgi:hypothetical protein
MFNAALFTIAKLWKQLRCPTIDECIYVQPYTIQTYRIIKLFHLQVNEWNIMISKVNHIQKDKGHMFSLIGPNTNTRIIYT